MVMILWIVGKLNQRLLALDRISAHMAAAPGLIVGVFVGASLNLLELATLNTPPMFIVLAMMLFGWRIGVDIVGQGVHTLLKTIPPAAISTLVAITIALISAYITDRLLGFPFLDAALGFMPVAFQVMPVVALEVGADGLYVTTYHLVRVLAMGMLIPFFASYWSRS